MAARSPASDRRARAPDGTPVGCTISAFCSLSLDPPLVLVCIGRDRRMHDNLAAADGFVVNVLAARQGEIALAFAGRSAARFAGLPAGAGRLGLPCIHGAVARLECRRHSILPGGDHAIVVGEVVDAVHSPGEPLLYVDGVLRDSADGPGPHVFDWLTSPQW
ncbi:flavin reductase family protein [Actinomadura graeca]|uniref:Flavin reductase family protein n=1 Tax=Actinomadura graeca TaxID=2750812 RepID=A0ABX8QX37_9ACTN|nr:flavin reductase family protein [Actinomadura graeca]QXJ23399.1 flavin reductase family protein [Actinomadura graeca]